MSSNSIPATSSQAEVLLLSENRFLCARRKIFFFFLFCWFAFMFFTGLDQVSAFSRAASCFDLCWIYWGLDIRLVILFNLRFGNSFLIWKLLLRSGSCLSGLWRWGFGDFGVNLGSFLGFWVFMIRLRGYFWRVLFYIRLFMYLFID